MRGRLISWGAIAKHLDRSTRTVQRWHSIYGLPVQRLGGDRGTVFTYVDKLDEWMRSRGSALADEPDEPTETAVAPLVPPGSPPIPRASRADSINDSGTDKARSAELVAHAYRSWKVVSYNNIRMITRHFREAIDLDPTNAAAFAGLSHALVAEGFWGIVNPSIVYTAAQAALQEALDIDPTLLEAMCAKAWLDMVLKRDWISARLTFDEILIADPSLTRAMVGRAMLCVAEGDPKAACILLQNAALQNPISAAAAALHCWCVYLAGDFAYVIDQTDEVRASGRVGPIVSAVEALASIQFDTSEASIQRIEPMAIDFPHYDVLQGALGYAYAINGHAPRAIQILDSLTGPGASGKYHAHYAIALILIGLNRTREAVVHLEQTYHEGSLWSFGFRSDPILAQLHSHPGFRQLMSQVSYYYP